MKYTSKVCPKVDGGWELALSHSPLKQMMLTYPTITKRRYHNHRHAHIVLEAQTPTKQGIFSLVCLIRITSVYTLNLNLRNHGFLFIINHAFLFLVEFKESHRCGLLCPFWPFVKWMRTGNTIKSVLPMNKLMEAVSFRPLLSLHGLQRGCTQ